MKTSEQIDQIAGALAAAQGKIKNPEKNRTATIPMKAGGKYSFNYADLPSTFDACREAFAANGLAHTTSILNDDGGLSIVARIVHSSGQWFESSVGLPSSEDPKALAANITYLTRYLFTALAGIAADEDIDGDPNDNNQISDEDWKPKVPAQVKVSPQAAGLPHPTVPAPSEVCKCGHTLMVSIRNPNQYYCKGCKATTPRVA